VTPKVDSRSASAGSTSSETTACRPLGSGVFSLPVISRVPTATSAMRPSRRYCSKVLYGTASTARCWSRHSLNQTMAHSANSTYRKL